MTSARAYQRTRTEQEALRELERCAGTQFDPAVVLAVAEETARRTCGRAEPRLVLVSSGLP
jgi:HD-GYP domain-containing protein (c-di-GMP phosphodiesterase class II)